MNVHALSTTRPETVTERTFIDCPRLLLDGNGAREILPALLARSAPEEATNDHDSGGVVRNRLVSGAALTVVILALSATTVFAAFAWQASGGGQSNQGASYGFNVKSDMTGHLNYVGVTSLPVTVNSV